MAKASRLLGGTATAGRTRRAHAKAAIADEHTGWGDHSANLTGHGINENIELGLLIHGGAGPRRFSAHFQQLMRDQVLVHASD